MTDQEESKISIVVRKPKKVLHFSDGILEIFDDDEEERIEEATVEQEVNEKELAWTPWFLYKAKRIGTNVVSGLDYTGEKLASFLQITTPKYQYEINQFKKIEAKKALDEKHNLENTWKIASESPIDKPITSPPASQSRQSSDMKV